jgi:predicted nucleotidyltransferase
MTALEQVVSVSPKDRALLAEIKGAVQSLLPTATTLLYGSVARGTHTAQSDYDILVLTDKPLSVREQRPIRDKLFQLEIARNAVICTLFYAMDEWDSPRTSVEPFHREVVRDAILL